MRTKLHQWLMWGTEDWRISFAWGHRVLCWLFGHEPGADCALPEHDFCLWCHKPMPGKAPRK